MALTAALLDSVPIGRVRDAEARPENGGCGRACLRQRFSSNEKLNAEDHQNDSGNRRPSARAVPAETRSRTQEEPMSDTLANLRRKIVGAKRSGIGGPLDEGGAGGREYRAVRKGGRGAGGLLSDRATGPGGLHEAAEASRPTDRSSTAAKPVSAIVFGSDQGLVGQFNDVLADFVCNALLEDALPGEKKVWAVGERVHARLADTGLTPVGLFAVPTSITAITPLVGQILVEIEAHHGTGETGQLYLFHNGPRSGATYEPVGQRLLPLDAQWGLRLAHLPWPSGNLPEVVGCREQTLRALVRGTSLFRSTRLARNRWPVKNAAVRLAAMQRAEKNIDELMENLNQTFRQLTPGFH